MKNIFYYKSPIGILEITLENNIVTGIKAIETGMESDRKNLSYAKVATQLDEYFSGNRTEFELDISPKGTDFQKQVWEELLKIPYGETKCYQEIALALNKSYAQRAVGAACNKNPILIIIPCHRVISKNGQLCGFACGIDKKEALLKIELQCCIKK